MKTIVVFTIDQGYFGDVYLFDAKDFYKARDLYRDLRMKSEDYDDIIVEDGDIDDFTDFQGYQVFYREVESDSDVMPTALVASLDHWNLKEVKVFADRNKARDYYIEKRKASDHMDLIIEEDGDTHSFLDNNHYAVFYSEVCNA